MDLDQYLEQQSRSECIKIQKVMEKESLTYQEAVIHFLKLQKKSAKSIKRYSRDCDKVAVPFVEVMEALKHREKRIWEERKSVASSSHLSRQGSVLELSRQVSNASFTDNEPSVFCDKTSRFNQSRNMGRTHSVIESIPKLDL